MSDQPMIERRPFFISDDTVAVITLFRRRANDFSALWMSEMPIPHVGEEAAQQFIEQMEGFWTPHFLMALRKAISEKLAQEDKNRDGRTAFAKYAYPHD